MMVFLKIYLLNVWVSSAKLRPMGNMPAAAAAILLSNEKAAAAAATAALVLFGALMPC